MALAAGFEPANLFRLPVFKTGGLNRTLPSKHIKLSLQNYEWLRRTSRQCFLGRKILQIMPERFWWWGLWDLNPEPIGYEPIALTIALKPRILYTFPFIV